jgi:alpha-amylase/alpha-mannosidase (GH57 family)
VSHPLYVAFIWHQHQPLYKSRAASTPTREEYRLPWVRLHGIKDYLDLILMLDCYPNLHQTVNLVPSLILQIEDYVAGKAIDPSLELLLKPIEEYGIQDKQYAIDRGFDGNHHTLVDPHPHYRKLYEQRQENGITWCMDNWSTQDFIDVNTWHNLGWFDPLFWDDPAIAGWFAQEHNFGLEERQQIYAKQQEILCRIIAKHKAMQDSGQLEVTTTPYTHPILPLLADTNSGRVAVPEMKLPKKRFQWPEDIPRHLNKARKIYEDRFDRPVRGLWPSEQSVSPAVLPYIAEAGFKWIVSDEAVLGWTLKHFFHRDEVGNIFDSELMYRPYRLETPKGDLSIVFRDHRLSDLIGFTYSSMKPSQAAADLVGHLEAISRSFKHHQDEANGTSQTGEASTGLEQPWLVTIALDGENCWEFYERDGVPFLDALYSRLNDRDDIKLVTVSEFLDQYPATETLPAESLHSGSWVDGNFTTWIGDPAKNRAWDLLFDARQTLENHPEATEEANPDAWEAMYAAEGSDWFWWFGAGHSSSQDAIFDALFREHLAAVYMALGEPIPEAVLHPLEIHDNIGDHIPQSFIHPIIDGIGDEQDWAHAGRIEVGGSRGTMHRSSPIQRIFYGFDHLSFYLRLDFGTGVDPHKDCPPELHLLWYYPGQSMHTSLIPLAGLPNVEPLNYRFAHHLAIDLRSQSVTFCESWGEDQWHVRSCQIQVGLDKCLEIAIPWSDLPMGPDWTLNLTAILAENEQFKERLPEGGLISLCMP